VANGRDPGALRPEGPVASTAAGHVEPVNGRYAGIEIEGRTHRIYFEQAGGVPGEWRLDTNCYVNCIDAVIRGLGLKRPVLMGSSMGGQICLEMAYRFGDKLGGVIACEACDKITGREVPFAKHALYNQTTRTTGMRASAWRASIRASALWPC
jgi:pimeloyl-ACP methyl ester carboxylesterase